MSRFGMALKRLCDVLHELHCSACRDYDWRVKARLAGYRGQR